MNYPASVSCAACATLLVLLSWSQIEAQTTELNPLNLTADHATISVADMDKLTEWYGRVLGFREESRNKKSQDYEVRHLAIPGFRVDLVWEKGSVRHPATSVFSNQGWVHIVFRTTSIDAVYKRLTALGINDRVDRDDKGQILRLFVHDPEGNESEIVPQP